MTKITITWQEPTFDWASLIADVIVSFACDPKENMPFTRFFLHDACASFTKIGTLDPWVFLPLPTICKNQTTHVSKQN